MKIAADFVYKDIDEREKGRKKSEGIVELASPFFNSYESRLVIKGCYAYPPFINSHDHLIGNWFPRAGNTDLYPNAHIWVNDMVESDSVKERDKIWVNALPMNFYKGNGKLLAQLGAYKNIFSGVNAVQDHSPNQQPEYYDMFPINVIRNYRQCHSLGLGNFWGGEDPVKEWESTKNKMPFILHLAEGLGETVDNEFQQLKELNLLQNNTLIIHGIALKENEIEECAQRGTSICWCSFSNIFLIGKTLDIESCLKYGVNVVIGTDSTLSGSANLFEEMRFAHKTCPSIKPETLLKMVAGNARKALFLPEEYGKIKQEANENILLMKVKTEDPYENVLKSDPDDILLLMEKGRPLFGQKNMLKYFNVNERDYFFYKKKQEEYFVIGHPEHIMSQIDSILGYKKKLPYLPFQ